MSMTVNLLAILISLAMMLTGAGADGQDAGASRTLVLHNVSIAHNVDNVELAPTVRLGVSTDGSKAVYDFAVELDDEKLMPLQLGVDESGITALAVRSDAAVKVTAGAVEAVMAQLGGMLEGSAGEPDDGNSRIVSFITEKYIPAYAGLLDALKDKDFRDGIKAQSEALFEGTIDRGEGTPVTELIEGEECALTEYRYTVENDQIIELAEAVYSSAEPLKDYYDAMFGLYALMPEESGLRGVASFRDIFERTGMQMHMDVVEKVSEDETVKLSDVKMTMDMSGVAEKAQALDPEAEGIELPPMVIDIHASQIDDVTDGTAVFSYEIDGNAVDMSMHTSEEDGEINLEMTAVVSEDGSEAGSISGSFTCTDAGEDGGTYIANCGIVVADQAQINLGASGSSAGDGTCFNSVSVDVAAQGETWALSFDLDVVPDAIEDLANGHEAALVIDDLSEEGINALTEDGSFTAVAMQMAGSLSLDAQKLMNDESVQQLVTLVGSLMAGEEEPAEEDAGDDEYEFMIDGIDYDDEDGDFDYDSDDYEYEEIEDDGELGFEVPEFTWLPEGWSVLESNQDTAYDWADVTIGDGTGKNLVSTIFFMDSEEPATRYAVAEDGTIAPVEGSVIEVSDFGEGSVSVTLHEADLYTNMIFTCESIDMDTIGRIVAGIRF